MNNCSSHVTKIDHLASWQNRPCLCLRVCQSKICILLKHACWWMKAIIFRALITLQIHVGIQCSSDISELKYPYYKRVFCVYAHVNTHTYTRVCLFVMHSHTFLYMKHCWINKTFLWEWKKASKWNLHIVKTCMPMNEIYHISSFDHFANSPTN